MLLNIRQFDSYVFVQFQRNIGTKALENILTDVTGTALYAESEISVDLIAHFDSRLEKY